jgi:heme/copper-type cytochrome/quinol oxidase subunit 2
MSFFSIITMIIVVCIVWGGVTFFMIKAFKYEKAKKRDGEEQG